MTYKIAESNKGKTPAEIYEEIKRNAPNDLLLRLDEYMKSHQNENVSKQTLAEKLFDEPEFLGDGVATWLTSGRDRNIRDAVADLVTYLHLPIIATSGEKGYRYVTDESEVDAGIADLTKRVATTNARIEGLREAKAVLREKRMNIPVDKTWHPVQSKLLW